MYKKSLSPRTLAINSAIDVGFLVAAEQTHRAVIRRTGAACPRSCILGLKQMHGDERMGGGVAWGGGQLPLVPYALPPAAVPLVVRKNFYVLSRPFPSIVAA